MFHPKSFFAFRLLLCDQRGYIDIMFLCKENDISTAALKNGTSTAALENGISTAALENGISTGTGEWY